MVLQKIRESLALLLLTLLPLHALLVTVGTKLIAGPNNAPLSMLALWKEGFLAIILLIALCEIVSKFKIQNSKFDILDTLILSLLALSIIHLFLFHGTNNDQQITKYVYGLKYDFIPLLAFLLLRRVSWSQRSQSLLPILLIGTGALVSLYGIISFFLPATFFSWLGYSDLHSLYVPDGPVAAFQQIGASGIRRIQSTMSGPNQLGLWLLIPLSFLMQNLLSFVSHTKERSKEKITAYQSTLHSPRASTLSSSISRRYSYGRQEASDENVSQTLRGSPFTPRGTRIPLRLFYSFIGAFLSIAIFLTFSRAAWISATIMTLIAIYHSTPKKLYRKISIMFITLFILVITILTSTFPSVILRFASSRDHLIRPLQAIQTMVEHPLGLGLGSAGPASNRTSDACVFLESGADASWATDRPELCVFVGETQVQPTGKTCSCPMLPENWYLQIGVELGILGFVLFLTLIILILSTLWKKTRNEQSNFASLEASLDKQTTNHTHAVMLCMLGISIAALFLHAWEDAAVAYTVWILVAITISQRNNLKQ